MRALLTCVLLLVIAVPAGAWGGRDTEDQTRKPARRMDGSIRERHALLKQLERARMADDAAEAARLQALLFPPETTPSFIPPEDVVEVPDAPLPAQPLWNSDVLIHSGSVGGNSLRGLCVDNDQEGNIYVGLIDRGSTVDTFHVYRSDDDGATWRYLNGVRITGRKLQSCAMHIADSTGRSVVGILLSAVTTGSRQDGSIYWVSFRDDGSGWRAATILSSSGGYGYNNVSLVSDAYHYGPTLTWWFGAAARVDSTGTAGHILALRSINWGLTWPYRDTVRATYDDRFPSIDYNRVAHTAEYHSHTQYPIRDTTTIRSQLPVDASIRIGAIRVQIDSLRHTWDADLDVYLFSPWGDSVELFTDVGASGDNFIRTLITDTASVRITAGSAPFTGAFKPEAGNTPDSSFNVWQGELATGTWVLQIRDDSPSDTGRLYGWSLWIEPEFVEEVVIAGEYMSTSDSYIRMFHQQAGFGSSSGWDIQYLTPGSADRRSNDFAVDWSTGKMGIVFADNGSGTYDIKGIASPDGGQTWSDPFVIAGSARDETFCSLDNSSQFGDWRLCYLFGGDSVMYRSSSVFGSLGSMSPSLINDHAPSTSVRPEVGVHGKGISATGNVVYAGLGPVNVYYDAFNNASLSFPVSASWNLLSLPLLVPNDSISVLYPAGTYPYGFAYDSATGYQQEYRMARGRGYWMKFPSATSQSYSGMTTYLDTFAVKTGWNLIGPGSFNADTSWVEVVPPGNRASFYFGYAGGYSAVQNLVAGQGYWVKMNGPGYVVFGTISRKK